MITLQIDGREVEVVPGTTILKAAEKAGIEIPVFCYHPRLAPVGACRMCLVRIEKMPKLQPACTTVVAEGMVVRTDTDDVMQSHEGVMDFLLSTHPLDCPVCDAGGECELQDNAMRYGSNESRFADPKRHFKKAWDLGPMVELDQERCIMCLRCIRFMSDVAGDPALTLHERGTHVVVDVADGRRFDSIFAGNTIQICPVGALTSRPYRFRARPWDLDVVDSICPHCPVGCHVALSLRHGDLLRVQSRDSEEVNWAWLCDRGRFGYGFVHRGPRLTQPMLRHSGALTVVGWHDALGALRAGLRGRVGALGGARSSLEAQYLMRRWLREAVQTENVDHRVLPLTSAIPPGPVGRIDDIDTADLVVLIDAEVLEEAPVLALRLRHFATLGLRLVGVSERGAMLDLPYEDIRTEDVAGTLLAMAEGRGSLGGAMLGAKKVLLLWSGRGRGQREAIGEIVRRRAGETYTMVVGALGNSYGGEAAGLVPGEDGLDARGMLEAAARGDLDGLFVMAQDLYDFPDHELVDAAIARIPFLAFAGTVPGRTSEQAHVVLPLAAWSESDCHLVNMEGRAQRCYAGVSHPGETRDDWRLFADLLGLDWGLQEVMQAVRADLPELFGQHRPQGGPVPRDGYVATPGLIFGASIFHKGVLPDPLLDRLPRPPDVTLGEERARMLGLADGDTFELGGERVKVRVSPDLPAGSLLVRAGTLPAGRLAGRLQHGAGLAGRGR